MFHALVTTQATPEALQDPKHSGSLFTVKGRGRALLPFPQLPLSVLLVQFRL